MELREALKAAIVAIGVRQVQLQDRISDDPRFTPGMRENMAVQIAHYEDAKTAIKAYLTNGS